ncbi:hypothetical protein TKK_0002348 [Trichogramma kaykai]
MDQLVNVADAGVMILRLLENNEEKKKDFVDGGMNDEEDFIRYTTMNIHTFNYIFEIMRPSLTKGSKRPPLPPELRFSLTIRYLAHNDCTDTLAIMYNIGYSTVLKVIKEVCLKICEVLGPVFLKFPTKAEFQSIAMDFHVNLDMPNCIGAIDGRHCPIKKPPNSGSLFFNYKKFFSINLMTICDSEKRFIWANIGDYGSMNDAGVLMHSDLGIALNENVVQLPPITYLPGSNLRSSHYFVGDGIFPLKTYLMKPFNRNINLTVPQRIFNYRLSHSRRIVECAFGQLSQQWQVNQNTLNWSLLTSEKIIMSTLILHNILIDIELNEVNNRWSKCPIVGHNNRRNDGINEFAVRNQLCEYFVSPAGDVPYQWENI